MLTYISIDNYTIIDHLELEFHDGMTVVTGETGAGKSIMLGALALALGARADYEVIRAGAERCDINVAFDINHLPEAKKWLREHDLTDDECFLRRVLSKDGRSRAYINGQVQNLQSLQAFSKFLIQIHSQHAHQQLCHRDAMRDMLDHYAGLTKVTAQVNEIYHTWHQAQQQLTALTQKNHERDARLELLRYQVQELNELAIEKNELNALHDEHKRLINAEHLRGNARTIITVLADSYDGNAESLMLHANDLLTEILATDPTLKNANELLQSANIQLHEAIGEIRSYADKLRGDPKRLTDIDTRLSTIHALARKHSIPPEQLYDFHKKLNAELTALKNSDAEIDTLQQTVDTQQQEYNKIATQLTTKRFKAANQLNIAVSNSIRELGMPQAQFQVDFEKVEQAQPCLHGKEKIIFTVSTNPGQALQPINKVASGGELSRISLALHTLTASKFKHATLIFDEVDTGIGGHTAHIVGQHLRELSQCAQVLCVTHLPQVAAQAHHHFHVAKRVEAKQTFTSVTLLKDEEKTLEIARMLGGKKDSKQSVAHAKEMLEAVN